MRRTLLATAVVAVVVTVITVVLLRAGAHVLPPFTASQAQPNNCSLASPAFCETFSAPAPNGNRAGQLDGVLWGASRVSSGGGVWWPATASTCNTAAALPPNDVQVCNGQLVETVNDGGEQGGLGQTILGLYPKQPFSIAGRTAKATFDVGNDTDGGHGVWPAFSYTDQPSPAPYDNQLAGVEPVARNSFGFDLDELCGGGSGTCQTTPAGATATNCASVGTAWTSTNYTVQLATVTSISCTMEPTVSGQLNHYEVDFLPSGNEVDVYGSDPGGSGFRLISKITGLSMPLSTGVIWIEDAHYNACKFGSTCNHSFIWDNVGFDGPLLPRDLDTEVPDALSSPAYLGCACNGAVNTQYIVYTQGDSRSQTLTFGQPVAAIPSAAMLTLNLSPGCCSPQTLLYSLNGNPVHQFAWPAPASDGTSALSEGVLVSPSELHVGTNTVQLWVGAYVGQNSYVGNVDIKLLGAGGTVPCNCNGPTPTPSATATPPPSSTPSVTATATPTSTPTLTPTATATATATSSPTATPTPSPTPAPVCLIAEFQNSSGVITGPFPSGTVIPC